MVLRSLRYLGTLYAVQAVFGGIVFLLADFTWLSYLPALAFLVMVWLAGRAFAAEGGRWPGALLIGLLWQVPGLQGTLRFVSDRTGWTSYDGVTDLQDFAMETWHTVLLPLLSAIPRGLVEGYYARYYIALVAVSPLLILAFTLAAAAPRANYLIGKR